MLRKYCQIILALCAFSLIVAKNPTKITASILADTQGEMDVSPFTKVGQKLYYFGEEKINWFNAILKCREMGSFLASIRNATEMHELVKYLENNFPRDRSWWLSGSNLQSGGKFYWYGTGEPFGYADWSPNQPDNANGNENCVHIHYYRDKHQLNDLSCDNPAFYICEAEKPTTVALNWYFPFRA